ncbi:ribosome-binding protein aMBF1 (putative translation factor) [Caldalkalibacillus uzonensis]|uniref:Ribosome-binding protein aMBF1 (Putative translation factor) n=1 Tax=Caldalkalibacillus uzonensis TaxID=353224 RepID=A0ABU0CP12_9BACI|nr:ribosome-binding protein aMBF1 (putative translation factor) [Caldalkalibacillus uzonensis]
MPSVIQWDDIYKKLDAIDRKERDEISLAVKIASAVIDRRAELGWSRAELARHAGLKESEIAKIESGSIPNEETLQKILNTLGIE